MKSLRFLSVVIILSLFSVKGFSQVTSVPEQAKSNFAEQYPNAQDVEWDNDIVNVNVRFSIGEDQMNAEYSNKGIWKSTLKESNFEDLPAEVQDGFKKSKYAEREITNVKVVYLPGGVTQYRLKVEKNDVQKKHLWFNAKGRLVRDANTL